MPLRRVLLFSRRAAFVVSSLWGIEFMRIAAVLAILTALLAPAIAANEPAAEAPADRPGGTASQNARVSGKEAAVEAMFRDFGLFGTWAADCGRPPTPDNPHVTVSTPSAGLVIENNDVGPGYAANRYSVLTARRLAANRIELRVIFRPGAADEERQTLVFAVRNGTRRTLFNRVEGGPVRVRDGIVVSHGIKTPLLRKCG